MSSRNRMAETAFGLSDAGERLLTCQGRGTTPHCPADRNPAVIGKRHLHVGADDAVGDRHAVAGERGGEVPVEAPALVGRGGSGEAGAVAVFLAHRVIRNRFPLFGPMLASRPPA